LKQKSFDPQLEKSFLPAKKISKDKNTIKEIVLSRIETGFYHTEAIQLTTVEKIISKIFRFPSS
jgi:hypothetical protein